MPRKLRKAKHKVNWPTSAQKIDKQIDLAGHQIYIKDYAGALQTCQRLLGDLSQQAPQRAQVLELLGIAHSMLQNFAESYAAYTEALSLEPGSSDLWFNRGIASRFTSRFGQSLRDFERAAELNTRKELQQQLNEELKFSRKMVQRSIQLRGPKFTLDQLIEQENYFQDGLKFTEAGRWEEAEEAFRRSIAMGDILPQPWGNVGISLLMRGRYDEAEQAFKRALEIDPRYDLAIENLAALPSTRRLGPPQRVAIRDPFKGKVQKQSIKFLPES